MKEISIVTPSYERLEYLILCVRALHSIDADFEHIIVCNPGNDGMKPWLESIKRSPYYHRLYPVYPNKHLGNADSMNLGIMMAKGKYIMQLDSDIEIRGALPAYEEKSEFYTSKIFDIFKYILKDSAIGVVGTTLTGIGSRIPTKPMGSIKIEKEEGFCYQVDVEEVPFITACYMLKRELLNQVGTYRQEPGKLVSQMCSDLSARIRTRKKKIVRIKNVEAWHIDGTSLQGQKYPDYFEMTNPPKE